MNIRLLLIKLFIFAFCTLNLNAAEVKAAVAAVTIATEEVDLKKQSAFEREEEAYFKQVKEKLTNFNKCPVDICTNVDSCCDCSHNALKMLQCITGASEDAISNQYYNVIMGYIDPDNTECYNSGDKFKENSLYQALVSNSTEQEHSLFYFVCYNSDFLQHAFIIEKRSNGTKTGWRIYQSDNGFREELTDCIEIIKEKYSLSDWIHFKRGERPHTLLEKQYSMFETYAGGRLLNQEQLSTFLTTYIFTDSSMNYYLRKFPITLSNQ